MPLSLSRRRRLSIEPLEARVVLHAGVNPTATLVTNLGDIEFELLEESAPGTVDNFLTYINDGDYLDSIFHRLVPGFVLQGGGFTSNEEIFCPAVDCSLDAIDNTAFAPVPTDAPIVNEFSVPNVRGTVAMAKLGGDPDSATNQFFVNLSDNRGNLDNQNGGFTVFARVNDMTLVDTIARLNQADISSIFDANQSPSLSAISQAPYEVTDNGFRWVQIQDVTGTGLVHGTTYADTNGNGTQDNKEGVLVGITVYDDANDNGELDAGEVNMTTGSDGVYHLRFDGDYDYKIRVVDFGTTTPTPVSGSVGFGRSADVSLGVSSGILLGNIFFDADADGAMGSNESPRVGVTVFDDANKNGQPDADEIQTTTDENGNFSLTFAIDEFNAYEYELVIGASQPSNWDYASTTATVGSLAAAESRQFSLAARLTAATWHNLDMPTDVDGINGVTPLDALLVINEINSRLVSDPETGELQPPTVLTDRFLFLDTNNDGIISPTDAIIVINKLNESTPSAALSARAVTFMAPGFAEDDESTGDSIIDQVFAGNDW